MPQPITDNLNHLSRTSTPNPTRVTVTRTQINDFAYLQNFEKKLDSKIPHLLVIFSTLLSIEGESITMGTDSAKIK